MMKQFMQNFDHSIMVTFFIFGLACLGGLLMPPTAVGEKSVADEIISLNVTDKPLGEVLENISDAAGCRFSIDAGWEDYPITASFKNEPLYKVLKRIFRNLNNAVIYGSDRTIKIIIYDEGKLSGKTAGYQVAIKPAEAPEPQAQPYSDATAPQPEVQTAEDSSDTENVTEPSEDTTESVSEANQAGTENTEAREEPSAATAEEKSAALEPEQKENAPDQESNQTEKNESAIDGSENSEKMESGEESNQN